MKERHRWFVIAWTLVLASLICGLGCAHWARKPVIPQLPTAREQFFYALERRERLARTPIKNEEMHDEYMAVIRAYEDVIERFPDDRQYTPMAHLAAGTLYNKINEPARALKHWDILLDKYGDSDAELNAAALTGKGESLSMLGRYDEARLVFLKCIDTYENDSNDTVKNQVVRCRRHLAQIQFK
ncbi:MAG: hypothetical protein Kow0059_03300 [Candidatus Sumerlaeia bacterium]